MIGILRTIALDRHGELRSVWRILLFLTLLIAISFLLLIALRAFPPPGRILQLIMLILAALLASFIMTRWLHRKPFGAFGVMLHPSVPREMLIGTLLGVGMMTAIFAVELGAGMVTVAPRNLTPGDAVSVFFGAAAEFLLAAALEEVLFRGYLFQVLLQWLSLLPAMVIIAVLFPLAHGLNPGIGTIAYVNIGLVSLTLCLAYYKTRGLWLPIGLHFGWNFAQTTLFGFPTSGMSPADLSLLTLRQSGPDWLTGGGFGPEGGVVATAAIIGGTWYLLKSRRVRAEEGIVTLDSLEDVLPASATEEAGA